MNIKRALFVENEFFEAMKHTAIGRLHRRLTESGVECRVIDHASKHKKEVFEGAMWADSVFFASTFLYENEVKGVGDLLIKIPDSKSIFGYCMSGHPLIHEIEGIWDLKELSDMSHHKLFEIIHSHFDEDLGEDYPWAKEIDLKFYADKWKEQEEERIKKNQGFPKTGRKVLIKTIQAQGIQWSTLKYGDIVDELNCKEIDPNPNRGVWVMGFDEPVKLLNSDGYEEWEYADLKARALALEFFSRGGALEDTERIDLLTSWIRECSGRATEADIHEWSTHACDLIGIERRGNRNYIQNRLREYKAKHVYFKESW